MSNSTLARSLNLLSRKDLAKLGILMLVQVFLSILDLLGVAIVGLLGSLAVTGIQSKPAAGRVATLLNSIHLQHETVQYQAAFLGLCAAVVLAIRTICSILFTRRTMFFLGRRGASISADLVGRLFSRPLLEIESRTSQQTIFSLTIGVNTIVLGVISAAASLVSDSVLLAVMAIGLLFVAPILAATLLVFFSMIGLILYRLMHQKIRVIGALETQNIVQTNDLFMEAIDSYRESMVRNRRYFYSKNIATLRYKQAKYSAELAFVPMISKYVIESSVLLGALLICGVQFLVLDPRHAVSTLAVFLAASTRIAPAVLRVQQGALGIRGAFGAASPTLDLIQNLENYDRIIEADDKVDLSHANFIPAIEAHEVVFTYPQNQIPTIKKISLGIEAGSHCAIVGPSGAGKTTLVDLLLGVIQPTTGSLRISGTTPSDAIRNWPGAIAYVPQNIAIANRSIRENVALGYPLYSFNDDMVYDALELAELNNFVMDLPDGLDTVVGERGAKLSGGQRQRLGIARALFTRPKLLVLDEATSALDGVTEAEITHSISKLKGHATIVVIAHRLSTIKSADRIIYVDDGRVVAEGTFEQIRTSVPDFESQAQIAGL